MAVKELFPGVPVKEGAVTNTGSAMDDSRMATPGGQPGPEFAETEPAVTPKPEVDGGEPPIERGSNHQDKKKGKSA